MALGSRAFDVSRDTAGAGSRGTLVGLLIILTLLLSACDEDERRAVAPGAVSDRATAVADDDDEDPVEAPRTQGSPLENGVLGIALPRAERVYFARGGEVWQIPVEGDPAPVLSDAGVAGFSPSATGHRLAVLERELRDDDEREHTMLSLVLPGGFPMFELSENDDFVDVDGLSLIDSIALTPAGNTLAMTHQNGAMTMVTFDGNAQQLIDPELGRNPGRLEWSSDGRFIAYLDPWLPNEPSGLYVLVPETGVRQVLVSSPEEGTGVGRAKWIPGTSHLVYTRSSGSTIPHGGDVFVVDALTGEQQLLLSSGEIAPVAGAVDLAVSPDGEIAALTAFIPGDEYPAFAGLWTIDLLTGDLERVPVEGGHSVTDIWWLGDNLLYRVIDEPRSKLPGIYTGLEDFRLLEYDPRTSRTTERFVDE
jgi:hypothetical protein